MLLRFHKIHPKIVCPKLSCKAELARGAKLFLKDAIDSIAIMRLEIVAKDTNFSSNNESKLHSASFKRSEKRPLKKHCMIKVTNEQVQC